MMRNKRRVISSILTLIILMSLVLSGCSSIDINDFNEDNAYNHIKELSSDKYGGRLPGTEGNYKATEYIANEFKEIGLTPINEEGSYLQSFKVISPMLKGKPVFQIIDQNGNKIKEYQLMKDYIYLVNGFSSGGEVTDKMEFINNLDEMSKSGASIILTTINPNEEENSKILIENDIKAVIRPTSKYKEDEEIINSVVIGDKATGKSTPEFINIAVKEGIFEELITYSEEGYKLNIKLDLEFPRVEASNVIGYIPGKNNKDEEDKYLLISAHFDHVGTGPDGRVYNGALDNASGTGMMLELARAIKESGKKPTKTIIFAAFNAEESGLFGSDYYALQNYARDSQFYIRDTKVINIDMIGSKEEVNLELDTGPIFSVDSSIQIENKEMINNINELGEELGLDIKTDQYSYSSDHWSFNPRGGVALTMTHLSTDLVHTPYDDISNVDKERLVNPGQLLLKTIDYYGYKAKDIERSSISENQLQSIRQFIIYLITLALIIIMIIVLLRIIYKNEKIRKKFEGKPIFTLILVILIITSILFYNSGYRYENVSYSGYKTNSWKNIVSLTGDTISEIYDLDNNGIRTLVKDGSNIKMMKIDSKGEIIQEEELSQISNNATELSNASKGIYFLEEDKLYLLNIQNKVEKLYDNVSNYQVIDLEQQQYIFIQTNEGLKVINNNAIYEIDNNKISDFIARIDNKERVHIIFKEKSDNNQVSVKYTMIQGNGDILKSREISNFKSDKEIRFGIEVARGYIFYEEKTTQNYIPFYLGNRPINSNIRSDVEFNGDGGILVNVEELPYVSNENNNISRENDGLNVVYHGTDKHGKSYIYLVKLYNGKIQSKRTIYSSKKIDVNNIMLVESANNSYIFWLDDLMDNKQGNLMAISSSNEFGFNNFRNQLLLRGDSIIKNIIYSSILFLVKFYWIVPGFILIAIWKLITKKKISENKYIIYTSILANVAIQMITFNLPYLTNFKYENFLIGLVIAAISLGIVKVLRFERKSINIFTMFIIFTIINMIFISTLYGPYSSVGGLDNLRKHELFQEENEDEMVY